jgi:hypothetical protein
MSKILKNSEQARTSATQVIKDFSSFMQDNPDFPLITTKLSSLSRKHIARLLETPEHWAHTPNGLTAMMLVNTGLNRTNARSKKIVSSAMIVMQQFIEETIGEDHLLCLPVFIGALENIKDEELVHSLIDLIAQTCWTLDGKQIDIGGARVLGVRSLEGLTQNHGFADRIQGTYNEGQEFDPYNLTQLEQVEHRSKQQHDQADIYSDYSFLDQALPPSVMDNIYQQEELTDETFLNRFLKALLSHSEAMSVYASKIYKEFLSWNNSSFANTYLDNISTGSPYSEVLYRFLDVLNAPVIISDEVRSKLIGILDPQAKEPTHVGHQLKPSPFPEEDTTDLKLSYLDYLTHVSEDDSSS